jgi:ABC-type protease/lipase transport system fused ATPase/permease subunit
MRCAVLGRIGAWLDDRLRPAAVSACFEYAYRSDPARASEAYRDLTTLRQFAESGACPMLFDVLWAPLFLFVLFLVHPLLGMIGAVTALLVLGLGFAGDLVTEAPLARSVAALTRSNGRFGVAVGNVHVIKAMRMLDGAARLVQQAAQDSRSAHDIALRRSEIVMLISRPVRALAQVLIMGAAAWLVLEQQRSPGIIFATSLLFGRALAPIEGAVAGWKAFAMALAAYRRLNGVMATATRPSRTESFAERPKGSLVVNNLGAAFPGTGHLMLRGLSFRLAPGECLGIIGPSGSGKSTLGRIIAGVCPPTVGSVRLDNIDVLSLRDSAPWRLGSLSRGFRQRLGLARAFYGDPHLVVLDEPNASLDSLGERMLLDAIAQLKAANTTVVIITHRIGILAATDKIAIMQGGMLSAFGDSEEIYERYLLRPQLGSREPAEQQQEP